MKLVADLHTHSKNSRFFHGKNTITEMAFRANELGLKEIAITDHSYKHLFRTSKDRLYDARIEVDDINKWSKTKVLLGVEANILDENGTIDIDAETLALIDILVVGYHRMVKTDFASFLGKQEKTAEAKTKATNAFLNAISKYPITILAHVDSILTTDLYLIGKACAEKGVMVEINNRHTNWSEEQMNDLLASGCMFVVSSDAHCREAVGEVSHAFDIITKYNIPSERIANVEFEYSEMTEEHKEINQVYDKLLRKQTRVQNEIKKEQEEMALKGSNLSKEMEDELEKIAREQGYNYSRPIQNPNSTPSYYSKVSDETSEEEYAENSEKFLNAINRLSDIVVDREESANQAENYSITEDQEQEEEPVDSLNEDMDMKTDNQIAEEANDGLIVENQVENQNEEISESSEVFTWSASHKAKDSGTSNVKVEFNEIKPKKNLDEVEKLESTEKFEEEKSDEVINLFSVNASQKASSESRKNSKKEEAKTSQKAKNSKVKPGAFIFIDNLTGETDDENK